MGRRGALGEPPNVDYNLLADFGGGSERATPGLSPTLPQPPTLPPSTTLPQPPTLSLNPWSVVVAENNSNIQSNNITHRKKPADQR